MCTVLVVNHSDSLIQIVYIYIDILNGKQCRSRSVGNSRSDKFSKTGYIQAQQDKDVFPEIQILAAIVNGSDKTFYS